MKAAWAICKMKKKDTAEILYYILHSVEKYIKYTTCV